MLRPTEAAFAIGSVLLCGGAQTATASGLPRLSNKFGVPLAGTPQAVAIAQAAKRHASKPANFVVTTFWDVGSKPRPKDGDGSPDQVGARRRLVAIDPPLSSLETWAAALERSGTFSYVIVTTGRRSWPAQLSNHSVLLPKSLHERICPESLWFHRVYGRNRQRCPICGSQMPCAWYTRLFAVAAMLSAGLHVLQADVDVTAFRPLEAYYMQPAFMGAHVVPEKVSVPSCAGGVVADEHVCVCAGLTLYRPRPESVALLQAMVDWMGDHMLNDQTAMNALIKGCAMKFDGPLRWPGADSRAVADGASGPDEARWGQMVFRDTAHGRRRPASASALPSVQQLCWTNLTILLPPEHSIARVPPRAVRRALGPNASVDEYEVPTALVAAHCHSCGLPHRRRAGARARADRTMALVETGRARRQVTGSGPSSSP